MALIKRLFSYISSLCTASPFPQTKSGRDMAVHKLFVSGSEKSKIIFYHLPV